MYHLHSCHNAPDGKKYDIKFFLNGSAATHSENKWLLRNFVACYINGMRNCLENLRFVRFQRELTYITGSWPDTTFQFGNSHNFGFDPGLLPITSLLAQWSLYFATPPFFLIINWREKENMTWNTGAEIARKGSKDDTKGIVLRLQILYFLRIKHKQYKWKDK